MKTYETVIEIIKEKIEKDYKEDIALLVSNHSRYDEVAEKSGTGNLSFYFIPKTEKGNRLSTQFLVDGVSYDLFPMQWERLVLNASMDSPQWFLFLETDVIYCGDDEALKRFDNLKEGLRQLLVSEEAATIRINKAYEYFNESYIYLYNMRRYYQDLRSVRLEGAKLLDKISISLAFINSTYYCGFSGTMIEESLSMNILPTDYTELLNGILFATDEKMLYDNAKNLVDNTRDLLLAIKSKGAQKEPYETIFTGYYEEIKRFIDQCRFALEEKRYFTIYRHGAYLLEEIGQFSTKVCEGIWYDNRNAYSEFNQCFGDETVKNLLEVVALKDDNKIRLALDGIEDGLLQIIKEESLAFLNFKTVEDFEEYFKQNR